MDEHELRKLMYTAQLPDKGTFVIRYPRGPGSLVDWKCPLEEIEIGKGRKLRDGSDMAVLTIGPIGVEVENIIDELQEHSSPGIAHYDMRFLKPLDEDMLHEIGRKFSRVITIEDGVRNGGMGSAVLEWMNDHGFTPKITRVGMPDRFIEHGTIEQLKQLCGYDKDSIKQLLK